jgi:hypothetical protein
MRLVKQKTSNRPSCFNNKYLRPPLQKYGNYSISRLISRVSGIKKKMICILQII